MAGYVSNPTTKFEDPMTTRSWVTIYSGSHWLPLKTGMRPLRMRRITWPRRGWKTITFLESPTPICLFNFGDSTVNIIKVIRENNARRYVKKRMTFCACAKSRDLSYCSRSRRRYLPYWTTKVEHILSFTAIFSNICTAHAQKRLSMNFRCKLRHRRSTRRPRFSVRVQNFGDWRGFPLIFAFYMPNVRHISTSGLFVLLT